MNLGDLEFSAEDFWKEPLSDGSELKLTAARLVAERANALLRERLARRNLFTVPDNMTSRQSFGLLRLAKTIAIAPASSASRVPRLGATHDPPRPPPPLSRLGHLRLVRRAVP
jgi:hypothetical protein